MPAVHKKCNIEEKQNNAIYGQSNVYKQSYFRSLTSTVTVASNRGVNLKYMVD